jgi:hypothetical protein
MLQKSRTFEINLGEWDMMKKWDCPVKNEMNGSHILNTSIL